MEFARLVADDNSSTTLTGPSSCTLSSRSSSETRCLHSSAYSGSSSIGPSMAVALLTTFYGAVLANMVFTPLATKLERNSENETTVHRIYALGAASISRQENPRRLEMLLNTGLSPGNKVISLLMKRVRSVTPLSMALAFGMYVLNAFGGMLGDDKLEIISPFKHFDPNYILANAAYDIPLVMISIVAILIAIPASYLLYQKRNIASAV